MEVYITNTIVALNEWKARNTNEDQVFHFHTKGYPVEWTEKAKETV